MDEESGNEEESWKWLIDFWMLIAPDEEDDDEHV